MRQIIKIKENYNDIRFIFDFFDRFAEKLKKTSFEEKTSDSLVFFDYYNKEYYYNNQKDVNKILDYCYSEYFFKIVLSGSSYYQKVKKVCDDLEIEDYIFDLFFRSFFLAIKDRYYCESIHDYSYTKNLVLRIVLTAYSEAFDSVPLILNDFDTFKTKAKMILKKLEESGLVSYYQNDITQNSCLYSYFPISCDTFRFKITKETKGYEFSIPMFDFLDLRTFLDNSDILKHNLLFRMDRALQTLVVISFQNAKFNNNPFSDNSYIKRLNLEKKNLEKKKNNA